MASAIVFAYHDVGVRCLKVLLAQGVSVPLVVTHRDSVGENIWFDSVAAVARDYGIPTITPDDPNLAATVDAVAGLRPDFLFSFYFRLMIGPQLLAAAGCAALNMHGSLLPKYRGRAPVNWAIIKGERETGATLHHMVEKPDAGDIVDQQAVPILPDDTAQEVFGKVTLAAELVLYRSLPLVLAEQAPRRRQDLAQGSYFGGRKPEDGRIDWNQTAEAVHNLVRGVAPPYPGAFTTIAGQTLRILGSRRRPDRRGGFSAATLYAENGECLAQCGDGSVLRLVDVEYDGRRLSAADIAPTLCPAPLSLPCKP